MQIPAFRPVGDHAVLVEFGDKVSAKTNDAVRRLNQMLETAPFDGFVETVPAYVNLLIDFDPMKTDHGAVETAVKNLLEGSSQDMAAPSIRDVSVCYEPECAPDLAEVAKRSGLTHDTVINAHLAGDYSVYMYGFAPGYAYLATVPEEIQLPRKNTPVRGVDKGSVLIAGPQCLVTTITMPTGWWIIGKSPTRILTGLDDDPFLFDVGDKVNFHRVSLDEYHNAETKGE